MTFPHTRTVATAALLLWIIGCAEPPPSAPAMKAPEVPAAVKALVKESYALKQKGENGEALEKLEAACDGLKEAGLGRSEAFASCLDDRASIMLRLGRTEEAATLFRLASATLGPKPADRTLKEGIRERLNIIGSMKKQGITCAEPPAPEAAPALPYFPSVEEMQLALGGLTRIVAPCSKDKGLEAITIRAHITGDGRLLLAYAKDKFAGSAVEKCVVEKLAQNIGKVKLPPFSACFRGFTQPFMLGPHPVGPEAAAAGSSPTPGAIPLENTTKTETPPPVDSAVAGVQALLTAFRDKNPDAALPFFFPADKFEVVKAIGSPARYHQKLVNWYREDMEIDGPRFRNRNWQVKSVELGRCRWKEPGTEGNNVAYWSCVGNTVTVVDSDETRRFEIRVLINWGTSWYITHLGPIRS